MKPKEVETKKPDVKVMPELNEPGYTIDDERKEDISNVIVNIGPGNLLFFFLQNLSLEKF